jgi:hypothetical protein
VAYFQNFKAHLSLSLTVSKLTVIIVFSQVRTFFPLKKAIKKKGQFPMLKRSSCARKVFSQIKGGVVGPERRVMVEMNGNER